MTSPVITEPQPRLRAASASQPNLADNVLVYGPFAFLLFGPLAFGAVSPLSIFILEAGASLLFLTWIASQIRSVVVSVSWNPVFAPMLAFLGLIALQLATRHSAYRYATYSEAMLYITYGLLCFLITQTLRRTSQLCILAIVVSVFGSAVALFAILQSASSEGKLYWIKTPQAGGWIYGPYVNHNHYAGLMEMLIPVPLVIAFTHFPNRIWKRLAIVSAALMAGTLFLSGSRGGMIAFLVELTVLGFFLFKRTAKRRITWALALFPIIMVCLLAWLGGSEFTQRVASIDTEARTEISGGTRMNIARDSLKMFKQKPLLGYGLGTFPEVYPSFRSFYTEFWINEAHDDYLQLLVETGLLGFSLMLWFLWTTYSRAIKKLPGWENDLNGVLTLAAILGCTGIVVHSFVDFNLHIPANAAIFYVLCILAAMEPRFHKGFHRRHGHSQPH
jgi:O-antigen ligase